jgi:hypothetical protein
VSFGRLAASLDTIREPAPRPRAPRDIPRRPGRAGSRRGTGGRGRPSRRPASATIKATRVARHGGRSSPGPAENALAHVVGEIFPLPPFGMSEVALRRIPLDVGKMPDRVRDRPICLFRLKETAHHPGFNTDFHRAQASPLLPGRHRGPPLRPRSGPASHRPTAAFPGHPQARGRARRAAA